MKNSKSFRTCPIAILFLATLILAGPLSARAENEENVGTVDETPAQTSPAKTKKTKKQASPATEEAEQPEASDVLTDPSNDRRPERVPGWYVGANLGLAIPTNPAPTTATAGGMGGLEGGYFLTKNIQLNLSYLSRIYLYNTTALNLSADVNFSTGARFFFGQGFALGINTGVYIVYSYSSILTAASVGWGFSPSIHYYFRLGKKFYLGPEARYHFALTNPVISGFDVAVAMMFKFK